MPNIRDHQSKATTKSLLIGDSTSGKTGALAALAAAGYKLRIADWDNGLDILRDYLTNPASPYVKLNPKAADNVSFLTFTDTYKSINGKLQVSKSEAWTKTMKAMMDWKEADGTSYGPITSWDQDTFFVGDSLTFLSRHAENFDHFMNGNLGKDLTQNEGRRAVGRAQRLIKDFLDLTYDESIKCNVLILSHVTAVTEGGGAPGAEGQASSGQGYPSAVGRALSPLIPRWFNNMLVVKATQSGSGFKRIISTKPQLIGGNIVSTKTSAPLRVKPEYPLESGLADFMRDLRGHPGPQEQPTSKESQ